MSKQKARDVTRGAGPTPAGRHREARLARCVSRETEGSRQSSMLCSVQLRGVVSGNSPAGFRHSSTRLLHTDRLLPPTQADESHTKEKRPQSAVKPGLSTGVDLQGLQSRQL